MRRMAWVLVPCMLWTSSPAFALTKAPVGRRMGKTVPITAVLTLGASALAAHAAWQHKRVNHDVHAHTQQVESLFQAPPTRGQVRGMSYNGNWGPEDDSRWASAAGFMRRLKIGVAGFQEFPQEGRARDVFVSEMGGPDAVGLRTAPGGVAVYWDKQQFSEVGYVIAELPKAKLGPVLRLYGKKFREHYHVAVVDVRQRDTGRIFRLVSAHLDPKGGDEHRAEQMAALHELLSDMESGPLGAESQKNYKLTESGGARANVPHETMLFMDSNAGDLAKVTAPFKGLGDDVMAGDPSHRFALAHDSVPFLALARLVSNATGFDHPKLLDVGTVVDKKNGSVANHTAYIPWRGATTSDHAARLFVYSPR